MISIFCTFIYAIFLFKFSIKRKLYSQIEIILDKMNQKEVYQDYFRTYATLEEGKNNSDPGFLHFYTQEISSKNMILYENAPKEFTFADKETNKNMPVFPIQNEYMINISRTQQRPYVNKTSTEFITVHDTGNDRQGADGLAHAKYVSTGEGVTTSWHFTVDEKTIFQHMPLSEKAYHAGDKSNPFNLSDSGIKSNGSEPEMYFDPNDKYLYINNQKSLLKIDNDTEEVEITPDGLYWQLGENGNYYINHFYYNSDYKKISNGGGNSNSIGIESCIQEGVIYSRVMRNLGNLVSRLLDYFNLDPRRVMKHRNFSGKLCPQSMIRAKEGTMFEYKNLMNLISEYYDIIKKLPGAKFTYKSNNPDLLDDNGFILKYVEKDTEVSYRVTVQVGGTIVKKEYKTIIHPKTE